MILCHSKKGCEILKWQGLLGILVVVLILTMSNTSSAVNNVNSTSLMYISGQKIAKDALNDKILDLTNSKRNLLITTAGSISFNSKDSTDSIQAIIDTFSNSNLTGEKGITYSNGNLILLNNPRELMYVLVSQKSNGDLYAKKYTINNNIIESSKTFYISISQMSEKQLTNVANILGRNIIRIANAWAVGCPPDLLAVTFSANDIRDVDIASYAMLKTFALTFGPSGFYYIIMPMNTTDLPMYGIFGFDVKSYYTNDPNLKHGEMVAICYNNTSKSGVLALMRTKIFDEDFKQRFSYETGIPWQHEKYFMWLLKLLQKDPKSLFEIEALKTIEEKDLKYLLSGVDKDYIKKLRDTQVSWATDIFPIINYSKMFNLGVETFNSVYNKGLFKIDELAKGYVGVVVPPYYCNVFGKYSLVGYIDGIYLAAKKLLKNAGYNEGGFTIRNILQIRNPWTWFSGIKTAFIKVEPESTKYYENTRNIDQLKISGIRIDIDPVKGALNTTKIFDISPAISSSFMVGNALIPAVAGIAYAWAANAPQSFITVIGRVGCICSLKYYDLAEYAWKKLPPSSQEYYIFIALVTPDETNRQISGRTTAFAVSPSQSTYYALPALRNAYADYSILILWDKIKNTGKAMLLYYNEKSMDELMTLEGYVSSKYSNRASLFWHLDKIYNEGIHHDILNSIISIEKVIPVTSKYLKELTTLGVDPIRMLMTYILSEISTLTRPPIQTMTIQFLHFPMIISKTSRIFNIHPYISHLKIYTFSYRHKFATATSLYRTNLAKKIQPLISNKKLNYPSTKNTSLIILLLLVFVIALLTSYVKRKTIVTSLNKILHKRHGK